MRVISIFFALGVISANVFGASHHVESGTPSASVTIQAPIQSVWKAIWDFNSYGRWNTLVKDIQYQGNSSRPSIGDRISLKVFFNGAYIEHPKALKLSSIESQKSFCWDGNPWFGVKTKRCVSLTSIPGNKTRYYTTETVSGFFAGTVMQPYGETIRQSLVDEASQLKRYVERARRSN